MISAFCSLSRKEGSVLTFTTGSSGRGLGEGVNREIVFGHPVDFSEHRSTIDCKASNSTEKIMSQPCDTDGATQLHGKQ